MVNHVQSCSVPYKECFKGLRQCTGSKGLVFLHKPHTSRSDMRSTDAFTVWLLSFPEHFADINNANKWQTLCLGDSKKISLFLCALSACLPVYYTHGWWLRRPEEGVWSLGTGVTDIVISLWVLDRSLESTWRARCITSNCNVSTSIVRWEMGRESRGRLDQPDSRSQHSSKTKRPWLKTMGKVIINSWSLSSDPPHHMNHGVSKPAHTGTRAHIHTENVTYEDVSWLSGQSLYDLSTTFNKWEHKLHIKYSVFTAHSAQHINTLLIDQKEADQG